jgi:hypothetical protein
MKFIKTFEAFVNLFGEIETPDYLIAGADDDIDAAYEKGREAYDNESDIDENPYRLILKNDPETAAYEEKLAYAWEDGWKDASRGSVI